MPSLPTCAALHTYLITKTGLTTWPLWLAGITDACNDATDDTGRTIPANTLHVATNKLGGGGELECVCIEPAASSPEAGKWVIMVVAPTTGTHANAVMRQEAAGGVPLNKAYFGIVFANAGTTISVAGNYTAWDAATPFSGTCWFPGFIGLSDTATPSQLVYRATAASVQVDCQSVAGGLRKAGGGAPFRGVSDGGNEGENGLLGALLGYWCTGLSNDGAASQWSAAPGSGNGVMFQNHAANGYAHCYFRPPGTNTVVACGINAANNGTAAFMASGDDDAMLGADGTIEGDAIMIHRHDTGRKVGRLRTHFWGPRRRNKEIMSDTTPTKLWFVDSTSSTGNADGFLNPL